MAGGANLLSLMDFLYCTLVRVLTLQLIRATIITAYDANYNLL